MPRKHNYCAERSSWTEGQIELMNDLLDYAEKYGCRIPWRDHEDTLGHPYSSIITMASRLRTERSRERMRKENAALRAAMDMIAGPDPQAAAAAKPKPPAPKVKLAPDSHRITTDTQGLIFVTEMRARVLAAGSITAGVLGDPPPGRSALDRMRAGIIDAPPQRYGRPESKWSL